MEMQFQKQNKFIKSSGMKFKTFVFLRVTKYTAINFLESKIRNDSKNKAFGCWLLIIIMFSIYSEKICDEKYENNLWKKRSNIPMALSVPVCLKTKQNRFSFFPPSVSEMASKSELTRIWSLKIGCKLCIMRRIFVTHW